MVNEWHTQKIKYGCVSQCSTSPPAKVLDVLGTLPVGQATSPSHTCLLLDIQWGSGSLQLSSSGCELSLPLSSWMPPTVWGTCSLCGVSDWTEVGISSLGTDSLAHCHVEHLEYCDLRDLSGGQNSSVISSGQCLKWLILWSIYLSDNYMCSVRTEFHHQEWSVEWSYKFSRLLSLLTRLK